MREEEKIFAGKLFDARKKELRDIKHKAHTLCQKFNTIDEYDEDRLSIIKNINVQNKYGIITFFIIFFIYSNIPSSQSALNKIPDIRKNIGI